jgi:hypothetical protein
MQPKMAKKKLTDGRWYTSRQAAEHLRVTEGTIKRYCRAGSVKGMRIGPKKQWHVSGAEIGRLRKKWQLDAIDG